MKKRMILALVLVLAMLCMACAHDADEGTGAASGSESSLYEQSVSVAETSTESSAESSSSADGTSGGTSTESDTLSEASGTTTSADSTSSETSTGTESSATSSDTSSESSKPAENSKPSEGSENGGSVDTSSGSGNTNPSQTAHTHSYKTTVVKPTCTEDGYTLHKCSCGDSYKDSEVPATGHDLAPRSYKRMRPPTYTEPPVYARQCYTCEEWVIVEGLTNPTGGPDWEPAMTGTEEDLALVRERFQKLKEEYPDGTKWGYDEGACSGFAGLVSNRLFGAYWSARMLSPGFKLEDVHPGDKITQWDKNHECIVWEVFDDYVTIVEGNVVSAIGADDGKVRWGRKMYREEVESAQISTYYNPLPR